MKDIIPKYVRSKAGVYAKCVGNGSNEFGERTYLLDFLFIGQQEQVLGSTVWTYESLRDAGVEFLDEKPTEEMLRSQDIAYGKSPQW